MASTCWKIPLSFANRSPPNPLTASKSRPNDNAEWYVLPSMRQADDVIRKANGLPGNAQHLWYLSRIQDAVGNTTERRPDIYGDDEFATVPFVGTGLEHGHWEDNGPIQPPQIGLYSPENLTLTPCECDVTLCEDYANGITIQGVWRCFHTGTDVLPRGQSCML